MAKNSIAARTLVTCPSIVRILGPACAAIFPTLASGLTTQLPAAHRASIGQDLLIRAAIEQLTRLFGTEAGQPRATLLKDWSADEWTSTKADHSSSGHPAAAHVEWLVGPWSKRLLLAGSETSTSVPGYLAGAVEASARVVRLLEN